MDPAFLAELQRRHAEPHRRHHGWSRVAGMLAMAEEVAHGIADRPSFILALLFHTAVFDRAQAGNARKSAALMRDLLAATVPEPRLARAEALIHAFARQEMPETDDPSLRGDAALLLDMDNAPLGAPPAEYDAYEAAIRAEYAHLPDGAWADGRAGQIRLLLWRDRIYRTDRFFLAHEKRARRNLERRLAELEAG
ncbi:HD domain-containing protein [Falsiroseomonas sp. CW058]|uniref:HD domain-containing protein n=1 Tax=Falsiroseomonas sp. CW058 TaxID=3388664 RepID=UPI003D31DC0B